MPSRSRAREQTEPNFSDLILSLLPLSGAPTKCPPTVGRTAMAVGRLWCRDAVFATSIAGLFLAREEDAFVIARKKWWIMVLENASAMPRATMQGTATAGVFATHPLGTRMMGRVDVFVTPRGIL